MADYDQNDLRTRGKVDESKELEFNLKSGLIKLAVMTGTSVTGAWKAKYRGEWTKK
jgi:hypothetical protein